MKEIVEFKIISYTSRGQLTLKVNELIKLGYQPYGYIFSSPHLNGKGDYSLNQSMVKYKDDSTKNSFIKEETTKGKENREDNINKLLNHPLTKTLIRSHQQIDPSNDNSVWIRIPIDIFNGEIIGDFLYTPKEGLYNYICEYRNTFRFNILVIKERIEKETTESTYLKRIVDELEKNRENNLIIPSSNIGELVGSKHFQEEIEKLINEIPTLDFTGIKITIPEYTFNKEIREPFNVLLINGEEYMCKFELKERTLTFLNLVNKK